MNAWKKRDDLFRGGPEFSNFSPPNFRTVMPLGELLSGLKRMLLILYDPRRFYERVLDSLERWQVRQEQKAPARSLLYPLRVVLKSVWLQGIVSGDRRAYWRFFGRLMLRWGLNPKKRRLGFELAISGHHFIPYARQVAETLEAESRGATRSGMPNPSSKQLGQAAKLVGMDST